MLTPKTDKEITIMRRGGRILGKILTILKRHATVGTTPQQLDKLAEELVFDYNAIPSFKGYQNYPATICASINEYIVHQVPLDQPLKEGDLLTIDLGVKYKGYHTDAALSFCVGQCSQEKKRIIQVTKKALIKGVKTAKAGIKIGTLSAAIQKYIEDEGYNVVRTLAGHAIGKQIHEKPLIPNFGKSQTGEILPANATICIEPMLTAGSPELAEDPDNHGFYTKDGSLSCHFEHTVLVTDKGGEILTPIP